jgi:hypothetical protein
VSRHLDDQTRQTNAQQASVTRQLLGILGEEEYFIQQEATRLRILVEDRKAKLLTEERELERALHLMKCPTCGMQLEEIALGDVRQISIPSTAATTIPLDQLERRTPLRFRRRAISQLSANTGSGDCLSSA